jgi:flagellar biosynthesis protein FlhF
MADQPDIKPGATYKFVVRSAEEAVQTIRERLGPSAKVLSVRQLSGQGLTGLFSKPRLEVVAQVGEAAAEFSNGSAVSAEPALPPSLSGDASADAAAGSSASRSVSNAPTQPFSPSALQSFSYGGDGAGESLRIPRSRNREALPRIPELLRRAGFSEATLARLQKTETFAEGSDLPLHHQLVETGRALRKQASTRKARPLPARTAFLGTAGVGRTTALCKWLARQVFTAQQTGRVVKAEFDRPNPAEGLAVFCEALGLSLEYYAPENPESAASLETTSGQFLYADLPGLSLRSPADNAPISGFLDREKFAGRVLVLNAAYDMSVLRRAYGVGADLGATHVVFTHLDELDHWGKLWDFLMEGELTPLFLATGSSLTGDCEEDAVAAVLRKTLPGA